MTNLFKIFIALPRALQWCISAVVFLGIFFGAIDPLLAWRSSLVGRAEIAQAQVNDLEQLVRQREGSDQRLALASRAHGTPHKPGEVETERAAIISAIGRVERAHGIVITSLEPRTIYARDSALQDSLGGDEELVRLVYVMSFQADPQTITAVLRDLEAAPEIQRIGGVRITRTGRGEDRTLAARFEPETWAVRVRGGQS